MIPTPVVLALSGGIDSVTLLHWLTGKHNIKFKAEFLVHAGMIDYGQRHVQELTFGQHHCGLLGVNFTTIHIPGLRGSELIEGKGGPVLPFRNAILLSRLVNLAVYVRADLVLFAANKSDADQFPDCRQAFIDAINATLKASEIPVEICAPFLDYTKRQIVKMAHEMGVDLNQTWSCYRGGAVPCGKCSACKTRDEALIDYPIYTSHGPTI
jgi:7-cyano-7-deazaguanine synthase